MITGNAFQDVYVHSKAAIMDDDFTIGYSNIGPRSFEHDSEANVAVSDKDLSKTFREQLWKPLIGGTSFVTIPDWYGAFERMGRDNAARYKAGQTTPLGLLMDYPYKPV